MTKYIITGASGWLGQNFLSHLIEDRSDSYAINIKENDLIRCLCLKEEKIDGIKSMFGGIDWIVGDLVTGEGLDLLFSDAEDAIVVHLAGLIHPALFSRDFDLVNFEGSKKLVKAGLEAGVSKIVVMSSNSPVGCNPINEHLFTEESPYSPYMGYGKSKFNLECYLRELMEMNTSPPIVIIRAPWFYGPFQPPRQKLFFEMVAAGKFPILGDGTQRRSMVYTDNLCQGLLLAIKKDIANNKIFWIADEEPYSMNLIVDTIKNIWSNEMGRPCIEKNLRLPSVVGDIAYFADFCLQSIGLYQQKIHVLSEMNKTIACSIEKSKLLLGYAPEFSLVDGMRQSIKDAMQ